MTRWYVAGPDGEPHGPYEAESLRAYAAEGRINGSTRLCLDGTTDWVPASSVEAVGIAPIPVGNDAVAFIVPINVPASVVISCWLGVVSMVLCIPLGPVGGPIAVILGVIGLRKLSRATNGTSTGHGLGVARAWIGIVTGSIGLLLGLAVIVFAALN